MNSLIKSAIALGTVVGARRAAETIKGLELEDMLGLVGLARKHSPYERALPTLGLLALGAAVGAGAALIFAPSSGTELRQKLSGRLGDAKGKLGEARQRLEQRLENAWERERGSRAENDRIGTHS
jgi:hypothetical protein